MAEKTEQENLKRYNYIGFDVYPGKVKEFWEGPAEEKKYREKVKSEKDALSFEREQSFIYVPELRGTEKLIMVIAALLTIVSFFLPWFSFTFGGAHHSVNALGFLSALPFLGSLGMWGTGIELPALIIVTALMLFSPLLSIIYIIVLFGPSNYRDKYFSRIKMVSRLFYIPIILWVVVLIFGFIGFAMPFGNLGIEEIGSSFNLLSFLSMTDMGYYLTFAGSLICSLLALEL